MLNLSSLFGRGLLIHIFAYSILFLYISFLKSEIRSYDAEVSTLKANLATEKEYTKNAFLIIDNQNLKIKQLKIELSQRNNSLNQKLQKRFSTIETPKTDDCLSKLKFYDTLLLEFSNGNYSK